MAEKCKELERYCKKIREEAFNHLTAIESAAGGVAIHLVPVALIIILTATSIVLAVLDIASKTYLNAVAGYINQTTTIATLTICSSVSTAASYAFIIAFAVLLCLFLRIYKRMQRPIELYGTFLETHREALPKYVTELKGYCSRLRDGGCEESFKALCLDLDELEKLVSDLKRKSNQSRRWNLLKRS